MYEGEERRMSQDEQLGYIRSKMESLQGEVTEFKTDQKSHHGKEEHDRERILNKLEKIQDRQDTIVNELTVYKRLFKAAIAVFIPVLGLGLGDLIKLLKGL
ncbi:hypothetical protein N9924_01295 [bacterium]|nr:hypothetical protein [bacterium]